MNKEASQPPYYSVVAPATRPLATVYLLATQRTTRARCEGLGVSDAAKLQLFHESAREKEKFICTTSAQSSPYTCGQRYMCYFYNTHNNPYAHIQAA